MLVVSDMHMGKSERIARRGGTLLPPYDTGETLTRLEADIARHAPRRVICLGDSFDDDLAMDEMDTLTRVQLGALMAGREWLWVEGNHDPGPVPLGGQSVAEVEIGGLTFRHIAQAETVPGEVSGHWHPKAGITLRHRRVSSPCFLHDDTRLILPAFGAYTGGLDVTAAPIRALFPGPAQVVLTRAPDKSIPLSICAA